MRIYLTHCSKEKEPSLKGTNIRVTPDKLYTGQGIQNFIQRCRAKKVNWGILSDLYGVYLPEEVHPWYEKPPDRVTSEEEKFVLQDVGHKLSAYSEILFFVRPETFHPFYKRVLSKTALVGKVQLFYDIDYIE